MENQKRIMENQKRIMENQKRINEQKERDYEEYKKRQNNELKLLYNLLFIQSENLKLLKEKNKLNN